MNWPRLIGLSLALGLHAGVLYALFAHPGPSGFADGSGSDNFTVVAEVRLEGADFLTQRAQQASDESSPARAMPLPRVKQEPKIEPQEKWETKAPLPQQTAEAAPQPPEPPRQESPPPEQQQANAQVASAAAKAQDEQQAAAALAAHRNELFSRYLVEFSSALDRHKVHVAETGNVLLQVTLAPSGQLLDRAIIQSSGHPELDRAAIASLERAAPFRPLPQDLTLGPLTFTVPFRFRTR
jgi:periplasmic protein TonB